MSNGHGGLDGDETGDKNKSGITFKTAPLDARFPNMNVTNYCFQMYYDYYRCLNLLGEGHAPCDYFKKVFTSMCPNAWITRWDGQRDAGTFPLSFPPKLDEQ